MKYPTISRPHLRPIGSPREIVVAHSDCDLADELATGLKQTGFIVQKSNCGISCLEKLSHHTTDVLLLDPDLLWGGGDGVLSVMSSCPEMASIPVLLLLSKNQTSAVSEKLKAMVSEVLILPSLNETIAERCVELAESRVARNLGQPIAAWTQPR